MAPRLRLVILALFLVMLDDSQGWKQSRTQTPPICLLRDWALTSWSRWIDCTFSCGKMARQWRQRRAFKLTNCFGFSPYPYRLDVLVQIRSCNQRCYNGGTIFGVVANKVSVEDAVRKVSNIAIRSLELGNRLAQF